MGLAVSDLMARARKALTSCADYLSSSTDFLFTFCGISNIFNVVWGTLDAVTCFINYSIATIRLHAILEIFRLISDHVVRTGDTICIYIYSLSRSTLFSNAIGVIVWVLEMSLWTFLTSSINLNFLIYLTSLTGALSIIIIILSHIIPTCSTMSIILYLLLFGAIRGNAFNLTTGDNSVFRTFNT